MGERRVDVVGALEVLADPPWRPDVLAWFTTPAASHMAHARSLSGGSRIAPQRSMNPSPTVMGRYVAGAARGGSAGAPERHGRSHRCQGRLPSELSRLPSPG